MENIVHQLQWKKYLTCCNGRSSWPGEMEDVVLPDEEDEVVDQL